MGNEQNITALSVDKAVHHLSIFSCACRKLCSQHKLKEYLMWYKLFTL